MNIFKCFKSQIFKILSTNIPVRKWSTIQNKISIQHVPATLFPIVPFISSNTLLTPSDTNIIDIENNISHLITLARMALEKGDIDRAEGILEMSLKICEQYNSYIALPYVYDILTSISFASGNFTKAEQLLVQVIEKLLQIGVEENSNHIIDFKLRLARIYTMYNEYDLAELGFKNCLHDQRLKILAGDSSSLTGILYVNILFWYGLHKIRKREYRDAKKLVNAAYDYSLKIRGLNSYQEMVILYTLSDLNTELEDYDLALQNIQSAILLGKGTGSLDMAKCFVKLAKIYMKLGAFKNARRSADEAYRLANLFNEPDTSEDAIQILEHIRRAESIMNDTTDIILYLD